jgi:putative transposase
MTDTHPVPTTSPRTLRVRIKDRHASALRAMAADVNLVWNYCNDLASRIFERERRFASAYELQSYLAGASKAGLRVGSRVFQEVARVFVQQRVSAKRIKLGWRGSRPDRNGFRLGWVPFKAGELRHDGERLLFGGQPFHVWEDEYPKTTAVDGFSALTSGNLIPSHRRREPDSFALTPPTRVF